MPGALHRAARATSRQHIALAAPDKARRWSSTARPACARWPGHGRCSSWATGRGLHGRRVPGRGTPEGRPWRRPSPSRPRSSSATAATCSSPRSASAARPGCWTRRSSSSAPAASARRACCTSPRPGVGTIGIVDFDVVDVSNLQRQVVHTSDRLGQPKIDSAADRHPRPQPRVRVVGHDEMLTDDNVDELIAGYDVILDGTDTFETRYTPQRRGRARRHPRRPRLGLPLRGPADRRSCPSRGPATAASTRRRRRPSWRPAARWPACWAWCPARWACSRRPRRSSCCWASARRTSGRLLIYDALDGTFQELQLRRDPACPACGDAGAPAAAAPAAASAVPAARRRRCGHEHGAHPARAARPGRRPEAGRGRGRDRRRGAGDARGAASRRCASSSWRPDGDLHRFVNVYLNDQDVRYLEPWPRRSRAGHRSRSCRRWPAVADRRRASGSAGPRRRARRGLARHRAAPRASNARPRTAAATPRSRLPSATRRSSSWPRCRPDPPCACWPSWSS